MVNDDAPPPDRAQQRYPTWALSLGVVLTVCLLTAAMVFFLSQPSLDLGAGVTETIPTPAPANSIRGIANAVLGSDRVLQESETHDRTGAVDLSLAFHAAALAGHSAVMDSVKADAFALLRALYRSTPTLGTVTLTAEQPYPDASGGYSWCTITRVALPKAVAATVQWSPPNVNRLWRSLTLLQRPRFCH